MNKLTDEEIINALECCIKSTSRYDCEELQCPACEKKGCYFNRIIEDDYPQNLIEGLSIALLDLINRKKAESERLKKEAENYKHFYKYSAILLAQAYETAEDVSKNWETAKFKAVTDFAHKLKKFAYLDRDKNSVVSVLDINRLLKEKITSMEKR